MAKSSMQDLSGAPSANAGTALSVHAEEEPCPTCTMIGAIWDAEGVHIVCPTCLGVGSVRVSKGTLAHSGFIRQNKDG
jgi:hypothetical protein